MSLRRFATVLAFAGIFALTGCQVLWASITSPSDWVSGTGQSISGSFRALSTSSGSGGGTSTDTAYRRDVRAFAAEFAQVGGSSDDFLRGIARVAESHGVSHWEGRSDTLLAIGEGLSDAGVSRSDVEALGARASGADPRVAALVLEGYAAAR
jgi:hypothetical protein